MTSHSLGIFVGGLIPAILFTIANLSAKGASHIGIGVGWYVLLAGCGVTLAGIVLLILIPEFRLTPLSGFLGGMVGFMWGIGIGCVIIALNRYGASMGVLTPLFNMNTLFTVLLALWIFAEWKNVKIPQLLIGSMLIVAGGVLVSRA